MGKNFYIETKKKECLPFDVWMTKLEMRAFGWKCKGDHTEYYDSYDIEIDWEHDTATAKRRFSTYTVFKRIKPYGNFLLKLLEFFMKIQSWIRRKLEFLFFGLILIGIGIGIFEIVAMTDKSQGFATLMYPLYILLFIYVPSLVYALLGFLTRKIFRLDKKVMDDLEKNGYAREQDL